MPIQRKPPQPEVDSFKYAELPDIRVSEALEVPRMLQAQQLLTELDAVVMMEKTYKDRGEEIKRELETLQLVAKLPGFRLESLCFVARLMPGRRTLDRLLLVENGVDPEVIDASMKLGEPYMERRFKNIAK
jgi:hypothetical protein